MGGGGVGWGGGGGGGGSAALPCEGRNFTNWEALWGNAPRPTATGVGPTGGVHPQPLPQSLSHQLPNRPPVNASLTPPARVAYLLMRPTS